MNFETKIDEIEIIPVKPSGGLIGFASFVLDKKYYVSSVKNGSQHRLIYTQIKPYAADCCF